MRTTGDRKEYDVVIVGGGMVGATLACALAAQPATATLSVLIVDAQPMPTRAGAAAHISFDSRSTALSAASRNILQRLDLWEQIAPGACAIGDIHVSDHGRFGSTRLSATDFSVEALGYVVENAAFGAALAERLQALPRCELHAPGRVVDASPIDGGMRVTIESMTGGEESSCDSEREAGLTPIETKLLVIAEGGRSPLCDRLGIVRSREDYGQHALIANVGLSQSHEGVAFERFTNTGPLAMLPLLPVDGEQRASLVWTLAADEAEEYATASDAVLLSRLQEKFGWRLGRLSRVGARAVYPLSLRVAQEQVRPGLVLLGNVAHTLHPVAGQGMNLSLRDIEALVAVLADAAAADRPGAQEAEGPAGASTDSGIGSMQTLLRYTEAREEDQALMIGVTDGLTKLFSSDARSKVLLRKTGLLSLDLIPALKRSFGARAMGFD